MIALEERPTETFHITDEASALWLLRKLANLDAEKKRIKKQAEALLRTLDAETDSLKHLYMGELEYWAKEELEKKGNRRKTLHTLQGTLRFRHQEAYLAIEEEVPAIEYADNEELTHCLNLTWELNRSAYIALARKHFAETGELLPGVTHIPERESFTLSFARE
jgi:hypothetical protein